MTEFQERAIKCEHKNAYPDYVFDMPKATDYCPSCYEFHCKDCKAYVAVCACGCNAGISGWPGKRWKTHYKKREQT